MEFIAYTYIYFQQTLAALKQQTLCAAKILAHLFRVLYSGGGGELLCAFNLKWPKFEYLKLACNAHGKICKNLTNLAFIVLYCVKEQQVSFYLWQIGSIINNPLAQVYILASQFCLQKIHFKPIKNSSVKKSQRLKQRGAFLVLVASFWKLNFAKACFAQKL